MLGDLDCGPKIATSVLVIVQLNSLALGYSRVDGHYMLMRSVLHRKAQGHQPDMLWRRR